MPKYRAITDRRWEWGTAAAMSLKRLRRDKALASPLPSIAVRINDYFDL